jgi:hypothetical protein
MKCSTGAGNFTIEQHRKIRVRADFRAATVFKNRQELGAPSCPYVVAATRKKVSGEHLTRTICSVSAFYLYRVFSLMIQLCILRSWCIVILGRTGENGPYAWVYVPFSPQMSIYYTRLLCIAECAMSLPSCVQFVLPIRYTNAGHLATLMFFISGGLRL